MVLKFSLVTDLCKISSICSFLLNTKQHDSRTKSKYLSPFLLVLTKYQRSGVFVVICRLPATRLFLARPIFDPEDGGGVFLRNVGSYRNYKVLYPRK
jgi:hypothetical protein